MRRSRNLDGGRVKLIVSLIRRMPLPPTWQEVIDAVGRELGDAYTRQALNAHPPIRAAYDERKRGEPARPGGRRLSPRARATQDQIDRLTARAIQAERERDACREMNARLVYNAFAAGVSEAALDAPLPPIDRSL